jgi:hypothetical protein
MGVQCKAQDAPLGVAKQAVCNTAMRAHTGQPFGLRA